MRVNIEKFICFKGHLRRLCCLILKSYFNTTKSDKKYCLLILSKFIMIYFYNFILNLGTAYCQLLFFDVCSFVQCLNCFYFDFPLIYFLAFF